MFILFPIDIFFIFLLHCRHLCGRLHAEEGTKELKKLFSLGIIFLLLASTFSIFVTLPQVSAQNVSLKLTSHLSELAGSLDNLVNTSSLLIKWSDVESHWFKHARTLLGVPPDAELIGVSIGNATFSEDFSLSFSETFFRCYKVVVISFQGGFSGDNAFLNITYTPNKHPIYQAKYDELADTIAPILLANYEQAKWWKGYPILSVNKTTSCVLPSGPYKYIIITKEGWIDCIRPLVKWKENKGLPVYIASVEWINRTYVGDSLLSKIKEFLKDAYNNWHFDYVVLAGGVNIIPTYYKADVPNDWYYVYLDENEPPEWSRSSNFPEAVIGRLPANTEEELQAIVSKLISYESNLHISDWLHTGIEVYGYDFEEGYKYFENHLVNLNYKRLIYGYNLTETSFIKEFNEGASFIFILAHGTPTSMMDTLNVTHIDYLKNNLKLPVIFSLSCSIAAFDKSPNLGSMLVSKPQGGAILFIGKTRVGADVVEDIAELGHFLELASWRMGLMMFYFRTIGNINPLYCILGDPEMSIWTIKPKSVSIHIPQFVQAGKNIVITITDSNTQERLEGIVVRVFFNDSWIELVTDQRGQVSIKTPQSMSSMNLRIYALFQNSPTQVNATVKAIPKVMVDKSYVSNNRCDVNSIQTIGFHVKWTNNGSDALGVTLCVNETRYVTNETGWISFKVKYETVGKRKWTVTNISYQDTAIGYDKAVVDPSIIWDEIVVEIQIESLKVGYVTVKVMLQYKSDNMPVTGASVFINGHKSSESSNGAHRVSLDSWIPLIDIRVEITKEGFKSQEVKMLVSAIANIVLWLGVSVLATLFFIAMRKRLKRIVNSVRYSPEELEREIKKYEGYLEKLEQLKREGKVSEKVYETLKKKYESEIEKIVEKMG
jgi:hypothetical protein